jgi:translocation and assembly module TamA
MNRSRTFSRLGWLPLSLLACALLQAPATAQTAADGQALTPEQRSAQRQAQRQATTRADKGPAFAVEIRAPKDIQDVLTRRLELPRFAELPGLDDNELARLLPVARKNAEEILATLGYFSPLVTIEQAPAVAAEPRRVIVSVDPGQPTQVTEVRIDFTGPIATEEGARAQREKIEALWTLRPGMRFTQSEWDAAKLAALRELTTVRYPVGKLADSRADIDPETHSARLSVTLDSGPAFKVGDMVISGLDRHSTELVTRLAQLPPGETYDQTRMLEAQQRLSDSGYFDSVYLSLDTSGGPEATVMRVKVREAKRQKLILGLGVNTDTGLRFSMEHTEHQLPVIGWRAVTKLLYEQPKKSLGTEWTAPPDANLWRWRTSAQVAREESGSFEVDSLLLRAGRTRTTESVDRSYFLQYERARNTGTNPPPDANALSANYVWTRRDFDSRLFPTSGHGLSLDVGGGVTVGDTRYPFGRLVGKWLGYIPLGRPGGQADRNVARGTRIAARPNWAPCWPMKPQTCPPRSCS